MAYLDVSDVTLTFKGIAALMGVSFTVEQGTIASLIGPNGAGKTSMRSEERRVGKECRL